MLYTAETMQCELLRLTFCIQPDFLEIHSNCCVYQQFVPLHCSVVAHDVNASASFIIYLLKDVLIVSSFLDIIPKASVNIRIQVFVWAHILKFLESMPSHAIARPYGKGMFTFMEPPPSFPKGLSHLTFLAASINDLVPPFGVTPTFLFQHS